VSLLEKIKGMFSKQALPEETRMLLSGVSDVAALRTGLDDIVTENEVEARNIEREINQLAQNETAHKAKIQTGDASQREKLNVLREIKRLRRRMDSLEKRHRIHQDNIDLHLGLFDRISEMQAMELKKVSQGQIEELSADYDEALDKHRDLMATARAAAGLEGVYEDSAEQAELAALEAEILAELAPPEPELEEPEAPAVEAPVEEAPVAEAPVAEAPAAPKTEAPVKVAAQTESAESASALRRRSLDEELANMEAELEAMDDIEDEDELLLE
jgi:ribonuclease E